MNECKYVVFRLDTERYGIPIESVERILPAQTVTRVPRTPKMMLGVFDMRGATVPAIDARMRFGMDACPEARNFVVVQTDQGRCALKVDQVDGIITLTDEETEPATTVMDDKTDRFMKGIGKQGDTLTILLDPMHVVPKDVKAKIAA
jgi:purine-binding chemotaxis protein CheW